MREGRHLLAFSLILALSLTLISCQTGPSEEELAAEANAEELAWLEETKANLDAKRQQIVDQTEELANAVEEEAGADVDDTDAGTEGEESGEEVTEEGLEALKQETTALAQEFNQRLIAFINNQEIYEGEELSPEVRQAFDMKADEDVIVAKEYISKGGDYQKAIDIYSAGLRTDPDNATLLAAKEEAEALQYMDEDRFSQVTKKMTQDEVRGLLGQVRASNVRDYEERGMVGWFYRKDDGGAAGVYFKETRTGNGEWVVATADFNAIKPAGQDDDES